MGDIEILSDICRSRGLQLWLVDVPADGDCMLSALALRIAKNPKEVRSEVTSFLKDNPDMSNVEDASRHCVFTENGDFNKYFERMSKDGWGDGAMLSDAANLYQKQIVVHMSNSS